MDRGDVEKLRKDELVALAERQAWLIEEQSRRIAGLQRKLLELEDRFEELERRSMRAAAPFARPETKRKLSPKRPGRKGGHVGRHRDRPADTAVDRRIEVPLDRCPHCGDALAKETDRAIEQTIIEIPPCAPETFRLITHRNWCRRCQLQIASSHPLQVSQASGAAGTHLGPRTLAIAASLNKGLGLTMRKTCLVLRHLLGLCLTPGGLAQALARMAKQLAQEYRRLLDAVKAQGALHTDETSWWLGRPAASLWVLTNDAGTYYRVVSSRTRAAAESLIGDYDGVLVSDCLNIYDDLTTTQQKCYAHHLKAIGQALEGPVARGSPYLRDMRALLQGAMALKAVQADLPAERVWRMRRALDENATRLLIQPRTRFDSDPANAACARQEERLRQRLAKQRDHLFTFLDHEEVEATNNRAERQLRPAVISRKLSCGNKTENGAKAWEILASLAATCQQKGLSFIDFVAEKISPHPYPQGTR